MVAPFRTFKRQRAALARLRDTSTNEVMYGGGARGGKSWLGNGWVIIEALDKPGSAWLVAREELTKLRDTTLLTFFKVAAELKATNEFVFNASTLTATFHNGSKVFFRELKYIPSDPMFDRIGSYDLTGAFVDESQQIHPQAVNVLRGRFSVLRGRRRDGSEWQTVPKVLYTCNPAKNWIYTNFYRPFKDGTLPDYKAFIPSLATDNPFVTQEYLDNLRRSDRVTVERLLNGNFDYDDDPNVLLQHDAIEDLLTNSFVAEGEAALTIDVARFGADKSTFKVWRGFRVKKTYTLVKKSVPEVAAFARELMHRHRVPASRVVVDEDGVGGGVRDLLPGSKGFVNGSRALPDPQEKGANRDKPENYGSLKDQCKFRMAARITRREVYIEPEAMSPTEWELLKEELGIWKRVHADKDGKLRALPKDKEKEVLGRSPDYGDNLMMRELLELAPSARPLGPRREN